MNKNTLTSLAACLVYIFCFSNSHASPWANPGDSSLRSDVEVLARYGLITGPVNNWPMSWKQITGNFYQADSMNLPPFVAAALMRVKDKIPKTTNVIAKAYISNEAEFFRGFEEKGRSKYSADVTLEYNLESTSFHLNGEYNNNGSGTSDVKLDGSYLSQDAGNWSAYIGAVNRWWGPGRETTTLLGTNARPMPSIGIRRIEPKAFQTKWLSWMGPWSWDIFVAKMEENRTISSSVFVGMKLGFEPIENFEVGIARALMLCGDGRSCGFKQWTHGLIGFGDLDNTGPIAEQPGNQLAQIDLSYTFSLNKDKNLKLYAEGTAEDIHIVLPFQYARLIGISLYGPFSGNGDQFRLTAEYSDTTGSRAWFAGPHRKGTIYNHFIYTSGYRYFGRVIGHTLDSNSRYVSIKATVAKVEGLEYSVEYRNILVNSENNDRNQFSSTRERINSFSANLTVLTNFGKIQMDGRIMDNEINTPLENKVNFRAGLVWEIGF